MPWLDERIEWIQDPDFPGAKTFRGHDGVRQWDALLGDSWETRAVDIEDLVERGDDVLAVLRLRVRGRGSGVDMEVPLAHLWTMRDGRAVRVQFYLDPAKGRAALEAVSQENDIGALAAAMIDALNDRNTDGLLALVSPDYEFHSRLVAVEGRAYRGREGFQNYFRDLDESFTDVHWALDEIVGGQGDDVLVVFRFTARGRESGTPVDMLAPQVWTFRDGRPWRNIIYASRSEALKALGLRE